MDFCDWQQLKLINCKSHILLRDIKVLDRTSVQYKTVFVVCKLENYCSL